MNLERDYIIFKDDYGKYKIGLNHKTMDGQIEYANFPVRFKKNVVLENKSRIKIKNYWLDFYNWEYDNKKGTTFYIFINEFEEIGKAAKDVFQEFANETIDEDLDDILPF